MECHSKQLCTTTLRKAFLGLRLHLTALNSTCLSRPLTGFAGSWWEAFTKRTLSIKRMGQLQFSASASCSATAQANTLSSANAIRGMVELSDTCVSTPIAQAHGRPSQELSHRLGNSAFYTGSLQKCVYVSAHSHPHRLMLISLPVKLSLLRTQD